MRPLTLAVAAALGLTFTAVPDAGADEEWRRQIDAAGTALVAGDLGEARRRVAAATRRLGEDAPEDWRRAANSYVSGRVALAGGQYASAQHHFGDALTTYTEVFGDRSVTRVRALSGLGLAQGLAGDAVAAQVRLEQALDAAQGQLHGLEAALGLTELALARDDITGARERLAKAAALTGQRQPDQQVWVLETTARVALLHGDRASAMRALDDAATLAQALPGAAAGRVALLQGLVALTFGDAAGASETLGQSIAQFDAKGVREHPDLAVALLARTQAQLELGRSRGEAESALQRAQSIARRVLPPDHPLVAELALQQARVQVAQGNANTALSQLTSAQEAHAAILAAHPVLAIRLTTLRAVAQLAAGAPRAALKTAASNGARLTSDLAPRQRMILAAQLADTLLRAGDPAAARKLVDEARAANTATPVPTTVLLALTAARAALASGDLAAADHYSSGAVRDARELYSDSAAALAGVLIQRSAVVARNGRRSEAMRLANEARTQIAGDAGSYAHALVTLHLGHLRASELALPQAERDFAEALASARKALPARHPLLLQFYAPLVDVLSQQGKLRDASTQLTAASAVLRSSKATGPVPAVVQLHAAAIDEASGRLTKAIDNSSAARALLRDWPEATTLTQLKTAIDALEVTVRLRQGDVQGATQLLDAPPSTIDPRTRAVRAGLAAQIAIAQGRYVDAVKHLDGALSGLQDAALFADLRTNLAVELSDALLFSGDYSRSLTAARQAVETARTHLGRAHPRHVLALVQQLEVMRHAGEFDEYLARIDEVVALSAQAFGEASLRHVPAQLEMAERTLLAADFDAAATLLGEARTRLENVLRPEHPRVIALTLRQARLTALRGAPADAVTSLDRLASAAARVQGRDHPDVVALRLLAAHYQLSAGRAVEAGKALERLAEQHAAAFSANQALRESLDEALATVAMATGNWAAVEASRPRLAEHDGPGKTLSGVAEAYLLLADGQADAAAERINDALRNAADAVGPTHPRLVPLWLDRAHIMRSGGHLRTATDDLRAAAEGLRSRLPAHPALPRLDLALAELSLLQGHVQRAFELARDVAETLRARAGEEHPLVAMATLIQARVHAALGDTVSADTAFKSARTLQEQVLGFNHPELVRSGVEYARFLSASGQRKAATTLLQRLAASAPTFAARHAIAVAAIESDLHAGNFTQADAALAQMVETLRSNWRANGAYTTVPMLARAQLAASQGKREQAAQALDGAQALLQTIGIDNAAMPVRSALAITRGALAAAGGAHDTARASIGEIVALAERTYGADSLVTAQARTRAASMALAAADHQLALSMSEQALATYAQHAARKAAGAHQALIVKARALLEQARIDEAADVASQLSSTDAGEQWTSLLQGLVEYHSGVFDDAATSLERAVNLFDREAGATHPATAEALSFHGAALLAAGQPREAALALRRAQSIQENAQGEQYVALIPTLGHLSAALAASGQLEEASKLLDRQRALIEWHWGEHSKALIATLSNLGELQRRAGRKQAARLSLERAVKLGGEQADANDANTARDKFRLANLLIEASELDEAERLLGETVAALEGQQPADGTLETKAIDSLAALKLARGDYDAAQLLLSRRRQ